jgi:hypothetical protein
LKIRLLFLVFLLWVAAFPTLIGYNRNLAGSRSVLNQEPIQFNPRVVSPVYVRLQSNQKGNVTLWQSVPQNFTDHVANIESQVLAIYVSSNSLGFNLSRDSVGNLWMAINYSVEAGDYLGTLTWMSSKATSENLTSLGFVPFSQDYPEDVRLFVEPGRKMPAEDRIFQQIAANFNQTANMTQTVKDILDFVNRQGYDRPKSALLMSGNLTTADILDFFEDAPQVLETNSSMCLERSWYAAAILRAAGIPARTVTDVRLKTWIQVWFPNLGWVDAEALCRDLAPHVGMLPKSVSAHLPWAVENSADGVFPFGWLPEVPMRVANLTFDEVSLFDANEYGTVLSEPIDLEVFKTDPQKFTFPIVVELNSTIFASLTRQGSNLAFSVYNGDENLSKTVTVGELNSIGFQDITVSFKPNWMGDYVALQDFSVTGTWKFDVRLLVPIIGIPVIAVTAWLYWRRRRISR